MVDNDASCNGYLHCIDIKDTESQDAAGVTRYDRTGVGSKDKQGDDSSDVAGVVSQDHLQKDAIGTIEVRRSEFSKREQKKEDLVIMLQRVSGVPSEGTIDCSATTNRIKNSLLTKRDTDLSIGMLGLSNQVDQGETTRQIQTI